MPRYPTPEFVRTIIKAYEESGSSAVLISEPDNNPRKFVVQSYDGPIEVWIYFWTLTHGGGAARPEAEYRIQITGITPPLGINPSGPTLLIGFEADVKCFAGFDIEKHLSFSTQSPSIQIPITTLHHALQHGLGFTRKGNDEIALGIRPDNLLLYTLNSRQLHLFGEDNNLDRVVETIISDPDSKLEDFQIENLERDLVIENVYRYSRDSRFRRIVINAYEYRCAVTRMQLNLIDAAHILPVGVLGSTDSVNNGICISPTYHRAFDRGLIYLDTNYYMRINDQKLKELVHENLDGGLNSFTRHLDQQIHLPQDRNNWPNIAMIEQANQARGIV
jgi:putative restriction endonuclease